MKTFTACFLMGIAALSHAADSTIEIPSTNTRGGMDIHIIQQGDHTELHLVDSLRSGNSMIMEHGERARIA